MTQIAIQSAWDMLKPNEQLFVTAYLRHDERSGAELIDYSVDEAKRFLARPLVVAAIHERRQYLGERLNLDAENIMREIGTLAFSNMADFVNMEDGNVDFQKMTRKQWACVKKIKRVERYDDYGKVVTTELELHPKLAALSELMKYLEKYAPTIFKAMMDNADNPAEAYARMINA